MVNWCEYALQLEYKAVGEGSSSDTIPGMQDDEVSDMSLHLIASVGVGVGGEPFNVDSLESSL